MTGTPPKRGSPPVEEPLAAKEAPSDPASISAADPGPPLPITTMATDTLVPQHHEQFTMESASSRAWRSEDLAQPGAAEAAPAWGGHPGVVGSASLPPTAEMLCAPSLGGSEGLSSEGGRKGGRHGRSPGRHWEGGGTPGSRAGQLVSGGPCAECGATKSTLFRRSAEGSPLCNACGLRYSRNLAKQTERQRRSYLGGEAVSTGATVVPSAARQKAAHKAGTSPKKTRRRLPPDEQRWCRQCGATTSPQWRYVDNRLACNACALRTQRRQERLEGKDVRRLFCCQRFVWLDVVECAECMAALARLGRSALVTAEHACCSGFGLGAQYGLFVLFQCSFGFLSVSVSSVATDVQGPCCRGKHDSRSCGDRASVCALHAVSGAMINHDPGNQNGDMHGAGA